MECTIYCTYWGVFMTPRLASWTLCLRGCCWRCCLMHRSSQWLCCRYIALCKPVPDTIQEMSLSTLENKGHSNPWALYFETFHWTRREHRTNQICFYKCKSWLVFPTEPQWPADHGQLQIRNTQVEKKPFYACPRCQSANSECNPTCNTCSSKNYSVIPAGQNHANFCKVGIGSDFEANFLER